MKIKTALPKWLLLRLFMVREVRDEKERGMFHGIWTKIWVDEEYAHEDEPLHKIETHYAIFDQQSTDLLLWFLGSPVGTLRIIRESVFGLPVLNDFEVEKRWEGKVVEFTLLTLKKEWRGLKHAPSFFLMREAYRRTKAMGARGIVIAADRRLFRLFQKVGMPFEQIGPEKFYEGSLTVPAFLPIPEAEEEFRKVNPALAEFFLS